MVDPSIVEATEYGTETRVCTNMGHCLTPQSTVPHSGQTEVTKWAIGSGNMIFFCLFNLVINLILYLIV